MFDKRSGRVFGALPTGRGPSSIALDLDRRRVYVAVAEEHAIEVIDLDQGAVLERRTLRSGDAPADLVVTPDGNTLLVAARGSSTLVFVDARSLSENDRVEVPTGPVSVVVDRQGLRAYVASRAANAVSSIDLVARRLIRSASVDAEPVRLQLDAAQTTLWVLHDVAPYLFGVDTRSLETTTRLNLGPGGTAFRLEPRTGRLLVARRDGGGIDAYDPFSRLPVENFATDGRVTYLSADAESNLLFAARPDASGITAYGLVGRAAAWSSDLGCAPAFIAVPGER
jgi:YVTN family beta-propeller protein